MSKKDIGQITSKEMKESILRSGYLIEQRVETILRDKGYYVEANAAYPDPITGKSRELDIEATSAIQITKDMEYIFPKLICECKNNSQPVIFFTKEPQINFFYKYEIKCAGMPVSFLDANTSSSKDQFIGLPDLVKAERFHHYCKGPVSTQYCSFKRKTGKDTWVAFHDESHHDALSGLIAALEANTNECYDNYGLSKYINIEIYYPLLILQGPLYTASLNDKKLKLTKVKHVQYRKEFFSKDTHDTYQIDVITESFLNDYLDIVDKEMEKIKNKLKRKMKLVRNSIDILVEKAKIKDPNETFRKIFEARV